MSITFTIPGKPFAKQRPRVGKWGTYTPEQTVAFENTVRDYGLQHFKAPFVGPVRLVILATFQPAKSWSKKKTAEHLGGYHTQKPDLDNCQKAILDGLNRVAYADDSQVAEIQCRKVWGPEARTVVTVEALS